MTSGPPSGRLMVGLLGPKANRGPSILSGLVKTVTSDSQRNKMRPRDHLVQSVVSTLALYPVVGTNALPFGLAVILIDLDHFITYLADTGDCTFRGLFVYYDIIIKNMDKDYYGLYLFHTVEFYCIGLLLGRWVPQCNYVIAGCLFHHVLDTVVAVRGGNPFVKAFSIIEYFVRRRRHCTSIKEVLGRDRVNADGIENLKKWMELWGVKPTGPLPR